MKARIFAKLCCMPLELPPTQRSPFNAHFLLALRVADSSVVTIHGRHVAVSKSLPSRGPCRAGASTLRVARGKSVEDCEAEDVLQARAAGMSCLAADQPRPALQLELAIDLRVRRHCTRPRGRPR